MPRHPAELRHRAVAAVLRGRPVREVADELGVSAGTLAGWVRAVRSPPPAEPEPVAADATEAAAPDEPEVSDTAEPTPPGEPEAVTDEIPVVADDVEPIDAEPVDTEPEAEPDEAEPDEAEPDDVDAAATAALDPDAVDADPLTDLRRDEALEPETTPQAPPARPVAVASPRVAAAPVRRRRSALLIAAAAVAVLGVVLTSVLLRAREVTGVDATYDQLAGVLDAAYDRAYLDACTDAVEVVGTLTLFDRAATSSLTHLSIVAEADDAYGASARGTVADARATLADHLVRLLPTVEQRTVQAWYAGSTDVMADCLASSQPETVPRVPDPTTADVQDLRDRLAQVDDGGSVVANLAEIRAAIVEVAPALVTAFESRTAPDLDAPTEVRTSDDAQPQDFADADAEDLTETEARLAAAVAQMAAMATAGSVLDTASLLADYAFVGETLAGDVILTEGVAILEPPSTWTPMVTPEPELVAAVQVIPETVGSPPPGPTSEPTTTVPTSSTTPTRPSTAPGTAHPTTPTTRPSSGGSTAAPTTSTPTDPDPPTTTEPVPVDPTDPPVPVDPTTTEPPPVEEPTTEEPPPPDEPEEPAPVDEPDEPEEPTDDGVICLPLDLLCLDLVP